MEDKDKRIASLEELVRFFRHYRFGKSSERYASPNQEELFNEAEHDQTTNDADFQADSSESEDKTSPQKKKNSRGRPSLPATLERRKVYHDLEESQKTCACGCQLESFDEVISEQLCVIPAQMFVRQHCRKKYHCPHCKQTPPVTATLPPQPLPKSNASPELLAHIIIAKFLDGLPFYRQEAMWSRLDIKLTRATQANWTIGAGKLVTPLMNVLYEHQHQGHVIHIDETSVQVLKEKDRPPDKRSYFWLSVGGSPGQKVYRFHYSPSRGGDVAEHLLDGFQGAVMSDDWSVYGKICEKLQLTHINCCDHARRKFKDALNVEPKNKKKKGQIIESGYRTAIF